MTLPPYIDATLAVHGNASILRLGVCERDMQRKISLLEGYFNGERESWHNTFIDTIRSNDHPGMQTKTVLFCKPGGYRSDPGKETRGC
jgi:hypothetical protein